jgi:hypothetical protein
VPFRADHVGPGREFLRRAEARGDLMRLAPGVYIAATAVNGDPGQLHLLRALARQLRHVNPIVASHETAALLHGIPLRHSNAVPATPRFVLDPSAGRNRPGTPRIRVVAIPSDQVITIRAGQLEGLRATDPTRTALDLASEAALPFALAALDHVARHEALRTSAPWQLRGPAVPEGVLAASRMRLLAIHATLSRRGRRRRREALALVDPRHESPGESASLAQIYLAGLPLPTPQARITTDKGPFYPDFYWSDFGVVGECDGAMKYLGGTTRAGQAAADARRVAEKRRELAIRRAGLYPVRWMASEAMYSPYDWLAELGAALRAGGWRSQEPETAGVCQARDAQTVHFG